MPKTIHCCKSMDVLLKDPKMPLEYFSISREYGIPLPGSSAIQLLIYCPWCGKKLPAGLRKTLYNILEEEYCIEADFGLIDDPKVPLEFKSDEWWKKRGL